TELAAKQLGRGISLTTLINRILNTLHMKRSLRILSGAVACAICLPLSGQAQLITNFAASVTVDGIWDYDPSTSTLSGTEGTGDSIFGNSATMDLSGATTVSLTLTPTTLPNGSFFVILDDGLAEATAQYTWSEFTGGGTRSATLVPEPGFDFSNVTSWSLGSGFSNQSIDVQMNSLSAVAVPEPHTLALAFVALLSLLIVVRQRSRATLATAPLHSRN
ncbi:MAG: hypothetical protein WA771_04720, partial [Chthoniobacterales bacterium]